MTLSRYDLSKSLIGSALSLESFALIVHEFIHPSYGLSHFMRILRNDGHRTGSANADRQGTVLDWEAVIDLQFESTVENGI